MKKLLTFFLSIPSIFAATPQIYYTDLDRGPAVPLNGGNGSFVTIYGARFGATRASAATVTIGGQEPARYVSWSDSKIVVRLGPNNATGVDLPVVVDLNGERSNSDVQFTIDNNRRIFYFDPKQAGTTSDTCYSPTAGTEEAPWGYVRQKLSPRSLSYFVNTCMAQGDIVYIRAGSINTEDNMGWGSVLTFALGGKNITWIAVVGYPGESAAIDGDAAGSKFAIRDKGYAKGHVIAGLNIVAGSAGNAANGVTIEAPLRIVGNRVSGPKACNYHGIGVGNHSATAPAAGIKILGNEITGLATSCNGGAGATKFMHSIYAKCVDCEIAWNYIHGNKTYNGIQLHDDALVGVGGYYNVSLHDNWIQGQYGSGINLGTINFPTGTEYVKIYNNILYNEGAVAVAYNEYPGGQIKGCIAVKDDGVPGAKGVIDVYNNTMWDCTALFRNTADGGSRNSGAFYKGGGQPGVTIRARNNIVAAPAYYWTDAARGSGRQNAYVAAYTVSCCRSQITGTNNLWHGEGAIAPSTSLGFVDKPQFVNTNGNFRLQAGSPAINSGILINGLTFDRDGAPRPSGPAMDIGAYEYQK